MKKSDRKPPRRAVALHYDGENAPTVTAKGTGDLAEQIIALAREHGVPIEENPELMGLLSQLDLGSEVPEELYRAVAVVIAYAYWVRGRVPEGWEPSDT